LAWQRLSERRPGASFCLVDQNPEKIGQLAGKPAVRAVRGAAILFLAETLAGASPPDWIVPAVPSHVVFEWLWRQRPAGSRWRRIPVPEVVGQALPFCRRGAAGELYLSLSNARCPDDCLEPAARCSLTGRKRLYNLYDYLENLALPDYTSLVMRSRQLAAGVGGYRSADLQQFRRQVHQASGKILISTSCRCHGVIHALEKLSETGAAVGL
jgi:hypothetical protein